MYAPVHQKACSTATKRRSRTHDRRVTAPRLALKSAGQARVKVACRGVLGSVEVRTGTRVWGVCRLESRERRWCSGGGGGVKKERRKGGEKERNSDTATQRHSEALYPSPPSNIPHAIYLPSLTLLRLLYCCLTFFITTVFLNAFCTSALNTETPHDMLHQAWFTGRGGTCSSGVRSRRACCLVVTGVDPISCSRGSMRVGS